jgi:hypothetical protein
MAWSPEGLADVVEATSPNAKYEGIATTVLTGSLLATPRLSLEISERNEAFPTKLPSKQISQYHNRLTR